MIRYCESLCLSDETLKAVGPFYLVSMPGEVKYTKLGKCVPGSEKKIPEEFRRGHDLVWWVRVKG